VHTRPHPEVCVWVLESSGFAVTNKEAAKNLGRDDDLVKKAPDAFFK